MLSIRWVVIWLHDNRTCNHRTSPVAAIFGPESPQRLMTHRWRRNTHKLWLGAIWTWGDNAQLNPPAYCNDVVLKAWYWSPGLRWSWSWPVHQFKLTVLSEGDGMDGGRTFIEDDRVRLLPAWGHRKDAGLNLFFEMDGGDSASLHTQHC